MSDPSPSANARRRTVAVVVVLLLVAGAGFALSRQRTPPAEESGGDEPRSTGAGGLRGGESKPAAPDASPPSPPPEDPFVEPPGPMRIAEARLGIDSRLEAVRVRALDDLLRRGAVGDPAIVARLEVLSKGPESHESALAMAVLSRLRSDRALLARAAATAARRPSDPFFAEVVRRADPAYGAALVLAKRAEAGDGPHPEAVAEVASALEKDPGTAGAILAREIDAGRDASAWLEVAAAIRPLPSPVASMLAERIARQDPAAREAALGYVLRSDVDVLAAPPALRAALLARAEAEGDPHRAAAIRALGRLGSPDDATLAAVRRGIRAGGAVGSSALIAARDLGTAARPVTRDLLDAAASAPPADRLLFAEALVATGGEGVGAYAASRLREAPESERAVWLASAPALAAAADAAAPLEALVADAVGADEVRAAAALPALARLDPKASSARTVATLRAALDDPRPLVRAAAASGVDGLATLPDELVEPLSLASKESDALVHRAALHALSRAWRFGAGARPLVAAVLSALGSDDPSPEERVGLVRTLAGSGADDAATRATLRAAAGSTAPDVRLAGLWGLSHVLGPTAEDRAAVATATADPIERVRALARSVAAQSTWK